MDFLDLTGWNTLKCYFSDDVFVVDAGCASTHRDCLHCKAKDALRKHGKKTVIYLDTPFDGRPVRVRMRVQRYRCRKCLATTLQSLPNADENRRITNRCIQYIRDQRWFSSTGFIARRLGCAEKTVRNVLADYTDSPCPVGNPSDWPSWAASLEKFRQVENPPRRRRDLIEKYGPIRCKSCLGWFLRTEMQDLQTLKCKVCALRTKSLPTPEGPAPGILLEQSAVPHKGSPA